MSTEPESPAVEEPAAAAPPQAEPTDAAERETASREAERYRRRLRETERERDGLRERLDRYERTEAERIAADRGLGLPSDMWVAVQLEDLRGDDGLDREKVKASVDGLLEQRPHWRRPSLDLGSGARGSVKPPPEPGLSALLGKQR